MGERAAGARIVVLSGDDPDHQDDFHIARAAVIEALHQRGFDLLVLPVGVFEGWWVDQALAERVELTGEQTWPLYRVWTRNQAFMDLLRVVQRTRTASSPIEVIGGLSRFHATGKALYSPHLLRFLVSAGVQLTPAWVRIPPRPLLEMTRAFEPT